MLMDEIGEWLEKSRPHQSLARDAVCDCELAVDLSQSRPLYLYGRMFTMAPGFECEEKAAGGTPVDVARRVIAFVTNNVRTRQKRIAWMQVWSRLMPSGAWRFVSVNWACEL
jgi:hypothetical protein